MVHRARFTLVFQNVSGVATAPLLVSAAYYLGALAAFSIGTLSDHIFAPFWPPNIVLFCTLLLVHPRRWWIFIAAVLPAHVLAEVQVGMPAAQCTVAFATNCAVAMLNAWGVRSLIGGPPWFGTLRQASLYIAITVIASPALVALGGAFVPILGGGSPADFWTFWANWYFANALPATTLAPFFLTWFGSPGAQHPLGRRKAEAVAVLFALAVACLAAFGVGPDTVKEGFVPTLLYLPIPLILWATLRFGERGASAAVLVVTLVSIWRNLSGVTLFSGGSTEDNVLALQVFLTAVSIPVLLLAAAIEELRRAQLRLHELAGMLLRAQDVERRRTAKELHESLGQDLAAVGMLVADLQDQTTASAAPKVQEISNLLQRALGELRSMSYLLHPPLLDDAGLGLALRSYVLDFQARTGIDVELSLPADLERLPENVELVAFRVVQEALANVYHHSESAIARVHVAIERSPGTRRVVFKVEDSGKGLPDGPLLARLSFQNGRSDTAGMGLQAARERLRLIGGQLQIKSEVGKTLVVATIPIP